MRSSVHAARGVKRIFWGREGQWRCEDPMKKKLLGLVVFVALVGGGWYFAREHFADANADQYLTEKKIPVYHALSFHGETDRGLAGFCTPCGHKVRAVIAARVGKEMDDAKKEVERVLDGGPR